MFKRTVFRREIPAADSPGKAAVARLRGSLKHLKCSTGELMALTRGERESGRPRRRKAR